VKKLYAARCLNEACTWAIPFTMETPEDAQTLIEFNKTRSHYDHHHEHEVVEFVENEGGKRILMGQMDDENKEVPACIMLKCKCGKVEARFQAQGNLKTETSLGLSLFCHHCDESGVVVIGGVEAAISSAGMESEISGFGVIGDLDEES